MTSFNHEDSGLRHRRPEPDDEDVECKSPNDTDT